MLRRYAAFSSHQPRICFVSLDQAFQACLVRFLADEPYYSVMTYQPSRRSPFPWEEAPESLNEFLNRLAVPKDDPRIVKPVKKKARGLLTLPAGLGSKMATDLGSSRHDETAAAYTILAFAAGVVPAPNFSDRTGEDAPDDFDRNVSTIAAHIAGLPLSLPTLARIAYGLEPSDNAARGTLAAELRQNYPDLSDLHFAGVALTTVEAIRERALTMPAGTLCDSSARLKLFAMGLGVAPERRGAIRILLVEDIDTLLSVRRPAYSSSVTRDGTGGGVEEC